MIDTGKQVFQNNKFRWLPDESQSSARLHTLREPQLSRDFFYFQFM